MIDARPTARRSSVIGCFCVAVAASTIGVAACGADGRAAHGRYYLPGRPHAFWAGKIGPNVARLSFPGQGTIRFLVVECRRNEPHCHQIGFYTESPFDYIRGTTEPYRDINEGPQINHPAPAELESFNRVFDLPVLDYFCEGPYALAPVDALLRQPKDTVIDRSDGQVVRLKKAVIPKRFHPEGVLVYGLLLPHANTIVVRAPGGRVVARIPMLGAEEESKFKKPNTPRNCPAQYERLREAGQS